MEKCKNRRPVVHWAFAASIFKAQRLCQFSRKREIDELALLRKHI